MKNWTDADVATLVSLYPNKKNADIAHAIGKTLSEIYSIAHRMKLKKSEEYLDSIRGFKHGSIGPSWMPIGSERIIHRGYLQKKMTDTGKSVRDWKLVHVMLWEERNGKMPPHCAVCFKDGNKANITIENLECITRTELMKRNTIHNLPRDLVELCQLKGNLTLALKKRKTT